MTNKYSLLVFDIDGTVIDSDLALTKIGLEIAKTYKVDSRVTIDEYLALNGPSLDESLPALFPGYDINELKQAYYNLAHDSIDDMTLFKGVKQLLTELSETYKLAIFTSRGRSSVREILNKFDLTNLFSFIVCGDDGFAKKPSAEGMNVIIKEIGVIPTQTLFIGDNWRDVEAGKNAGVDVAFVKSHRRVTRLISEPKYILEDITELKKVLI